MIITSGYGWVPLALIVGLAVAITIVTDGRVFEANTVIGIAFVVSGVLSFVLALWLRRRDFRTHTDPMTGKQRIVRKRHTLFFVPLEYASIALLLLGIWGLVAGPNRGFKEPRGEQVTMPQPPGGPG